MTFVISNRWGGQHSAEKNRDNKGVEALTNTGEIYTKVCLEKTVKVRWNHRLTRRQVCWKYVC